jgi:hypothetical protein
VSPFAHCTLSSTFSRVSQIPLAIARSGPEPGVMGRPRPACAVQAEGEYSSVKKEEGENKMKAKGDTRLRSDQHDRETGHLPEVGHVGGQHRVPERECGSTDEQSRKALTKPWLRCYLSSLPASSAVFFV